MPSPSETRTASALAVDRIACTGHGICASLLAEQITLDEWGYPVVLASTVDPEMGDVAIRLCPARALAWAARR
jgi:ferredoxin